MPLSPEDRARLIVLARAGVRAQVTGAAPGPMVSFTGVLTERRGCFVTLTNRGRLRGCIGTFQPDRPLWQMVAIMGRQAAQDPRFTYNPITASELEQLSVEVSVLSQLEPTREPQNLRVGTHGIYIMRGGRSGCFLPEVATDQGWDAAEFLSQCCEGKAGLPADAWKQPDTKVFLFTSEKFDQ
jgi:AmmeMemoRadiSam system protein A